MVQRPERIDDPCVRLVTLAYAAVFAVEGVGLWMRRRWAEWMTTIITASLIPLEVWELIHKAELWSRAWWLANVADRRYLYWHVSTHRKTPHR